MSFAKKSFKEQIDLSKNLQNKIKQIGSREMLQDNKYGFSMYI